MIDTTELTEQQLEDLLAARRNKTQQDRQAFQDIVETTVPTAVRELIDASFYLAELKAKTFGYFKDILALKDSVYGAASSKKNPQQSHTFSTEQFGIRIGYRVNDGWRDEVQDGIHKVNLFLESLAQDENSAKLVETIFRLLKKDAKGNLRASRVLELQQMAEKFNHAGFKDGVKIIMDAYKPVRTCWFIEAWQFDGNQEKQPIPLSMSSVDFPTGFDFDFLHHEGAV